MSASDLFTIVTPTLNSQAFLDETIASVVGQTGDFHIRYHVQDGASTDGTASILEAWQARLSAGALPIRCRGVSFSYSVSRDGGMYQAINRAFERARADAAGAPSVMGWINSDDRIAPGAFATIRSVMTDLPEVEFLTSRVSLINDRGATLGVEQPIAFERAKLVAGDYDGRGGPFVMQEGSFWTSTLWDKVGGLDEGFRLAGDWDLWRRLAAHAPLTTVDTLLGFHRRHAGQLTESLDRYYQEIDRLPAEKAKGTSVAPLPAGDRRSKPIVAQWSPERKAWAFVPDFGRPLLAPMIHAAGVAYPTLPLEILGGASAPLGAHPQLHLPPGVIWMNQPLMLVSASVPAGGRYELVIECRNWQQDNRIVVRSEGGILFDEVIEVSGHRRNILLRIPVELAKGPAYFEIESDRRPKDPREHFLLVSGMHLEIAGRPQSGEPTLTREATDASIAPAGFEEILPGVTPMAAGVEAARLREQLRQAKAEINLFRLKDAAIHR